MVTGLTRSFSVCFEAITNIIDTVPGERVIGLSIAIVRGRTYFIADTNIHEVPTAEELADIATEAAEYARKMGHEPRVALLSHSTFGNPMRANDQRLRDAVAVLDGRKVDFEYDGEMSATAAINADLMRELYPFCRLSGAANVLVMPALHSAHISTRLLKELGGGTIIGPMLRGLTRSAQIVPLGASVNDCVSIAALAGYDSIR